MAYTVVDQYAIKYDANIHTPHIWLHGGGKWFAQLFFMPDGSTLPADTSDATWIKLYFHLEDYQHLIDLLRYESPVGLSYAGSGSGYTNTVQADPATVGAWKK
ncbi:MAG TPA: hypothetical protein VMC08_04960 [Bacteroidales bacterium]|nr:hypothetical protein [Bacteroidales bacterium]